MTTPTHADDPERHALSAALTNQRRFLRQTVQGLTDEQIGMRTTVSELTLGGILKHVAAVEQQWAAFIVEGPAAIGSFDAAAFEAHAATFRVDPGETLAHLLARYEEVAARTEEALWSLDSLDAEQPLPEAPWFPPGGRWAARQTLLHLLAETAQHCGHADIIRESLDGAKTMG